MNGINWITLAIVAMPPVPYLVKRMNKQCPATVFHDRVYGKFVY